MSEQSFTVFFILVVTSLMNQQSFVDSRSCLQDFNRKIGLCSNLDLRSVPTDLLPDLRELDLTNNLLSTLKNDSFVRYSNLKVLCLDGNNISHIEGATFSPLKNLVRLALGRNPYLPTLTKSMFYSKSFSNLDARYTNLDSFASDILTCFVRGAKLRLGDNNLRQINWTSDTPLSSVDLENNRFRSISNETFMINNHIDALHVSGNTIEYIEPTAISSLRVSTFLLRNSHVALPQMPNFFSGVRLSLYIRDIEIGGANLHTINPGFFSPLHGKHLSTLNFGSNQLQVLSNNSFTGLEGVTRLFLDSNFLDNVEPSQFNGMISLRLLSVKDNRITSINSQHGIWNLSVTHLNLAGNELREINSSAFLGLETIQILDLSGNTKLHMIDNRTFSNILSLEFLDLSSSRIMHLSAIHNLPSFTTLLLEDGYCPDELVQPGNLGSEAPSLVELNLVNTALTSTKLWDAKKNISSFVGLYNISRLQLSKNPLSPLPVGLFRNLSNLKTLRLDDCGFLELDARLFNDLVNLDLLGLERNSLYFLPQGLFDHTKKLRQLLLDGNGFTYLSSDLFKYCPGLVYLDISENRLSGLNRSTFEPITKLHLLNLAYNPLVCSCDLKWLPTWLKGSVAIVNSIFTICLDTPGTLEPFRGKQLITFDPSEDCGLNIALYCCLVLVGVALVLILGLAYYQRWWIRYRLFLLKLRFIGYDEIYDDIDRRNYLYDIAIMHHEADDQWVNEHLRPALADRLHDYDRIVCGDNELMLGMHYLEAVHYAVENSFKTIFVISRAALQEQWFILKFRTALDYINDVTMEKMIIVFVEDIDDDELPFLIRLFLSDHRPYMVWPDNERGQHYFWKELIKDLTVNIRSNNLVPGDLVHQ